MAASQVTLLLSDLSPVTRRVAVRARIARLWKVNNDSQVQHLGIVFLDRQGNKMYGEVEELLYANKFMEQIKEGNLCLMRDFLVHSSNEMCRHAYGNMMIKITKWSTMEMQHQVPPDFPRYAYSLTNFELLPTLVGQENKSIDVIGIISAISDLVKVRLPGESQQSDKRNLKIRDIDGNTVDVALWGGHATSFEADDIYNLGQSEAIVILLVGTSIRTYSGNGTIICSDTSKFYINPDIPEKREYCARLGQQVPIRVVTFSSGSSSTSSQSTGSACKVNIDTGKKSSTNESESGMQSSPAAAGPPLNEPDPRRHGEGREDGGREISYGDDEEGDPSNLGWKTTVAIRRGGGRRR